nr:MAG TPA: cysteine-rich protein [Caudoviricetes sp.]
MKEGIFCPRCAELGRKPKLLAKYEDVVGRGVIYLFCKKCGKEIPIDIRKYRLDR